ncbi:MAG: hypothetical protein WA970_04625, partial [Gammaproteobacteria bacterium]
LVLTGQFIMQMPIFGKIFGGFRRTDRTAADTRLALQRAAGKPGQKSELRRAQAKRVCEKFRSSTIL